MFRKKPVVIEARQLTDGTAAFAIQQWAAMSTPPCAIDVFIGPVDEVPHLVIPTLEGHMTALLQDWIIRGVNGEFYPCKPDIFAATYEEAPTC